MKKVIKFMKLHKWFCRKSQHYIFGGRLEHQELINRNGKFNKDLIKYYYRFPGAYIRFMYSSIK